MARTDDLPGKPSASVEGVESESGDEFEVAAAELGHPGDEILVLGMPFSGKKVAVSLQPSRLAAAWLMWVLVTLLVLAFWLPLPRRRGLRGGLVTSSVPVRRR